MIMSVLMRTTAERNTTSALRAFLYFGVLALSFILTSQAHAASYSLSPASGSYGVGESFTVRVMVNTGGDAVNTGEARITYDTTKLTAVSVSKDGSPFNLWVTEPGVSGGAITFAGGGTSPLSGTKSILSITFRGKAEGQASVEFANASLLAGAGQNVLSGSTGATYTITAASATPEPEPTTPTTPSGNINTKIPPPDAPVIKSTTHPDQDLWYSKNEAEFSWDIPYGVVGTRVAIDKYSTGGPLEDFSIDEPPIVEWSAQNLEDGVWFFHTGFKNRGGWGTTSHYRLNIDTTAPEPFELTGIGGDLTAQVRFEARDALSGIALYRICIDGGRTRNVQPNELSAGGYTITNIDPGEHTIRVAAVDQAGNERSSETQVVVTGQRPVVDTEDVQKSGFGSIYWVSLLFMAALAVAVTMLIQERRKFQQEKDQIKREAMEVGEKLVNIFGVLRDEIEEKVLELSHKPNMTDNERSILEGLKDALDVSEELLDKEVEDVRKLLK